MHIGYEIAVVGAPVQRAPSRNEVQDRITPVRYISIKDMCSTSASHFHICQHETGNSTPFLPAKAERTPGDG